MRGQHASRRRAGGAERRLGGADAVSELRNAEREQRPLLRRLPLQFRDRAILRASGAPTPIPAPPAPAVPVSPPPVPAAGPKAAWAVLIDFDPTVDPTATPDISRPRPRLTFPLDLPELLIGRAGGKGHPEIPVEDEGVSSRHAKIIFDDAGEPSLLELGSTNGTRVNETIATPGLAVALKSGDQIVLGRWTRMTIKAK
jgi:hypothetical protein